MLRWYGYFKEAVTESPTENYRVRKVVVLFYLEDNSCQVVEPKEDNSGLPQVNTFVVFILKTVKQTGGNSKCNQPVTDTRSTAKSIAKSCLVSLRPRQEFCHL